MKGKRLTRCPFCDKKAYTALEPPYAFNRKYYCRCCGRTFRQMDADRKDRGWTDAEIAMGFKREWAKDIFEASMKGAQK